eukprot:8974437-Pyramimonas_sp.AAC.1
MCCCVIACDWLPPREYALLPTAIGPRVSESGPASRNEAEGERRKLRFLRFARPLVLVGAGEIHRRVKYEGGHVAA